MRSILSVYEVDLIIDALTREDTILALTWAAARYDSMASDEGISLRRLEEYESRAANMRDLRDKVSAIKSACKPMSVEVA